MKISKETVKSLIIVILFITIFVFIIRDHNKKINNNQTFDFTEFNKRMGEVDKVSERHPIYINSLNANYLEIATPVVNKYLIELFKKKGDVLNYKINGVKYVIANIYNEEDYRNGFLPEVMANTPEDIFPSPYTKDAFIVRVDYSVKVKLESIGFTDWRAGNGEQGADGWILNKMEYIMLDKVNGKYQAQIIGTGL